MSSLLLQQVRVLDPTAGVDRIADVLVQNGTITDICDRLENWPADAILQNGQGQILAPGLVDLYSHSCEPGAADAETLIELLQSAQSGGFVRLGILPNTQPVLDHSAIGSKIHDLYRQATPAPQTQIYLWGALTQNLAGEQLADLHDLATSGVVGFADGQPIANHQLLRRLLEYLQPYQRPIALWPLDRRLASGGTARQGSAALRLGLPGSPASSEAAAIAGILEVVAAVGTPVHLMRISTERGVQLIAAAKQAGMPITASTTWLHLLGDTETLADYDPNWRLDPPLGNPNDRLALIQAIANGVLEAIAIDHHAHPYESKKVAFGEAPVGAIGLELALPLLWSELVAPGHLSALQLWSALSTRPAQCWGQTPPTESILFDPTVEWVVNGINLRSPASNSPWFGLAVRGRVQFLPNAARVSS